ncbi:putative late blight resistance protein homolog R1A-3 [Henckelia pumila]|uniref:putative late blight resistance protein homolog R1A-3 n=1 Tax=Henckelia pumila TaxID=405737 RepID=UPI003C6DDE05
MENAMRNSYAVGMVLQDLEIILCCHHNDLGSGKNFSSRFIKEDIQIMYHHLSLIKSSLAYSYFPEICSRKKDIFSEIADTVDITHKYLLSKVQSLIGQNIDKRANGIPDQPTVLSMFLEFSNEEEHFVVYDAMVSLLHDLELTLSSDRDIFGSDQYLFSASMREDFQIMYDNLGKIDSSLFDFSRQSYDNRFMYSWKCWICFVAYRGLDYIDSWPQSFIPVPIIERHTTAVGCDSALMSDVVMRQQTARIESLNNKLKWILDNRERIILPFQGSANSAAVGTVFSSSLNWFRETLPEARNLVGLAEHSSTMPHPEPDIEYQISSTIDGGAQIYCRNLRQIKRNVEFVCQLKRSHDARGCQLERLHDDRAILQKSIQSLESTPFTGQEFTIVNNSRRTSSEVGKLVGFEQDLLIMLDRLDGYPPKLQVFAVIGMGGIGKTTFTQSLYDNPLMKHHFYIRAWFTISQHYQLREVLIGLLQCVVGSKSEIYGRGDEELKDMLYKSLKGMKYLIVLDDMWDKQVWDDIKMIFPDDKCGSRIVLTSRLVDVATHASPSTPHHLNCLDEDESWELLCSKIPVEELSPELLSIGKEIVLKCQGLPLAIVVVGGLLSKMKQTLEVWKDFAQRVSSTVMKESNNCENILALSYNLLPEHLKPCFLYMGLFPENSKIPTKKLIRLWIAEGFIRSKELESFEEVAEHYLENLIGRSLIQVNKRRPDGRIKTCYIHDLLRDLCLREAHKHNFFHVYDGYGKSMKQIQEQGFLRKCRRFCFHSSIPESATISLLNNARSFLWFRTVTSSNLRSYSFMNSKLLKVLDIDDVYLQDLPREILLLARLRYLALSFQKSIDRSIFSSTFHNMHFLTVDGEWNGQLPVEFWAMSNLRHLCLKRSFLSYWPKESRPNITQLVSASEFSQAFICQVQYEEHSLKILPNLQSLATIRPTSCTKAVFLSMPNLKKLGVYEDEEDYGFRGWFKHLIHLKELRTLKYVFRDPFVFGFMKPDLLPTSDFFPRKLMKLTLSGTSFPWDDMLKLSELPVLEVLKLKNHAFSGAIWKSEEGGFRRLKYLLIGRTNLQIWEADSTDIFPCLEHLVIMNCRALKEIPCDIGELPSLEKIELYDCSDSASASAEQILLEQQNNGNDGLSVHIARL